MLASLLRPPPIIARTLLFAALLGLWEAASAAGLVSRFIAPPPSEVIPAIADLFTDNELASRFLRTFGEVFAAAGIGAVAGMLIGWWLHRDRSAGQAYTDWIAATAAAPLVLLFPLFLVLFGRNAATIVAMGAVSALPPVILKTKEGFDGVRHVLVDVGRTFGLTRWQQMRMILFPAALPTIFNGLRLGLVFALINVIGVEFLIGFGGLGLLIAELGDRFEIAGMYAAILFVVLCSALFFYFTEKLETWLLSAR
jgi:ABC-type nitrate/sulfonate/bicarbonate transport system permease component